jgi:hypothetical protein
MFIIPPAVSYFIVFLYLLFSEYPRKKLVQDGQAMSKHLMMRNSRKNETKSGSNKIVLGELLMIIVIEFSVCCMLS